MKSKVVEFLAKVPLFSEMNGEEIEEIADLVIAVKIPEEETVFKENEIGNVFYIIKTGQVKITKYTTQGEEKILALIGPYSHFGEMALIEDEKRSASAISIGRVELYEIHRNDLDSLSEMNNSIGYKLMRGLATMLATRLRTMDDDFIRIFNQPFKSIKELESILSKVQSSVLSFGWSFEEDSD
jgi:CRP/FNR family transcriptional regulator, cyclic AMP receptor protein